MNNVKGLLVEIMGTDNTNYGVTSRQRTALLVGEDVKGNSEPDPRMPTLELVKGYGDRKFMAVPYGTDLCKKRPMFGGHFVYSSDSRFPSDQPIHVMDRFE